MKKKHVTTIITTSKQTTLDLLKFDSKASSFGMVPKRLLDDKSSVSRE
jgi:hypothetical protein